ncbi:hypothetical protein Tco_0859286 [Tanacetum coccineum]|uniref:Uncharacterized protein n=1 Tax=Tanacetum coccineum TaxID=301880 RepID=A0ABQ5BDB3_9ASTR
MCYRTCSLVAVVQEPVVSTGTPSSMRIDQDTPSTSTSQTTQEDQSYVIPTSVEEDVYMVLKSATHGLITVMMIQQIVNMGLIGHFETEEVLWMIDIDEIDYVMVGSRVAHLRQRQADH